MSATEEKKRNPRVLDEMFCVVWEGSESIDEVVDNMAEIFGVHTTPQNMRTRASIIRSKLGIDLKKFERGPREKLTDEQKAKLAKQRMAEKTEKLQAVLRSIKSPRLRNEPVADLVERLKMKAAKEKAKGQTAKAK